MTLINMISNKR